MSAGHLFNCPFGGLQVNGYDLIVTDHPWSFDNWSKKGEAKNAKSHYDCMSMEEIFNLPVMDLASDNCLIVMWATNPMLPEAIETMKAYGFIYKTAGTWHKKTVNGKTAFGTGYIFRSSNEPYIVGSRGSPKTTRSVRSLVEGVVREHSRKPEEFYKEMEKLMPNARRLELFSRQPRTGWETWGNEIHKFDEEK